MYTVTNFRTKKALRDALIAGKKVRVFQPNGDLYGRPSQTEGKIALEGPHYPEPHRWYAEAVIAGGVIVSLDGKSVEKMREKALGKAVAS
jgi:hypothetical protein